MFGLMEKQRQKEMKETNNEILAKTDAIDKRTQRLEKRTIRIEVRRDLLIFVCFLSHLFCGLQIDNNFMMVMIIMMAHHAPDQGSDSAGLREVEENSARRRR